MDVPEDLKNHEPVREPDHPLDPVSGAPLALPGTGSWHYIAMTWGAGLLVAAALAGFFLHVGDVKLLVATILAADPAWLAAAALFQVATYVSAAMVWRGVLANAGAQVPFRSLLNLAVLKLFANQALPTSGLSGDILFVFGLVRRGVDSSSATAALLVAYVSYFAAYLVLGLTAFVLLWQLGDLNDAMITLLVSFLVVIAIALILFAIVVWSSDRFLPGRVLAWPPTRRAITMMKRVRTVILSDKPVLLQACFFQAGIFLLDAATLWCTARAVGATVDAASAYISFMMASIVATLTPVPLGLGTFEGTSAGMLHFLGSSVESAVAATLILRGLTLWLPMIPGLWLMRRESMRRGVGAAPSG